MIIENICKINKINKKYLSNMKLLDYNNRVD